MRRLLTVLVLLAFISPAWASFMPKGTGHTISKSGNTGTVGHGSLLDEIVSQGKPPSMLDQIVQDRGRGSLLDDALSDHYRNGKGGQGPAELKSKLPNPHAPPWEKDPQKGKFDAKTPISAGKVAKALRGGVVPYLAGIALEEIIEETCLRLAGGTLQMADHGQWQECIQPEPRDGFEYKLQYDPTWFPTASAACSRAVAYANSQNTVAGSYRLGEIFMQNGVPMSCRLAFYNDRNQFVRNVDHGLQRRPTQGQPEGNQWRDIPTQAAEDKIKEEIQKPGNGPKVADAIQDYLDKGGEIEPDSPPEVSGPPQSSPSSTTSTSTTTDPATGNTTIITTTTNVTNNYTYGGSTVTSTQTTTTTKTDQEGKVVESTSTTTNPKEESPPTDTPLPPLPKLYERKYPEGMKGVWNEFKERLSGTSLSQLAGSLMPTVDSGSCPSWPMALNFASWASYGTHDVAPPCWIWDVARAILIFSALLLARRLIFGG